MEYHQGTVLVHEHEYRNGTRWGSQKDWYPDGKPKSAYTIGSGGLNGRWQRWDESGNLVYDRMWVGNEPQ